MGYGPPPPRYGYDDYAGGGGKGGGGKGKGKGSGHSGPGLPRSVTGEPPPTPGPPPPPPETDGEPTNLFIFDKLVEREKARVRRDFRMADDIREELYALGVEIWESKGERTWKARDGRIGPRPNHEGKCY